MFLPLILLLFIALPIAELWLILKVGALIGAGPTILLLLVSSLLGVWLVRRQGAVVWSRFNQAVTAGRMPKEEGVDGVLVILGGTLLVVPGFITDLFGLTLLLPLTRPLLRRRVLALLTRRGGAAAMHDPLADEGFHVRDFARSEQPRRRGGSTSSTSGGERSPEFDFETHQLHE